MNCQRGTREGASLNGRRIQVSPAIVCRSAVVHRLPYTCANAASSPPFANFIMNAQAVRRDGAAALDLAYSPAADSMVFGKKV